MRSIQRISIILLVVLLISLFPAPLTSIQAENTVQHSLDEALLLQISSYARMDPEATRVRSPSAGKRMSALSQSAQQINEHRVLAQLYQELENAATDTVDKAFMKSAADAHIDQAGILQRRRLRKKNPFNQIGRAVGWFFRQTGRALRDLTPSTLKELIKDYALHGTPISTKIFWRRIRGRLQRAVQERVLNEAAGVPASDFRLPSAGVIVVDARTEGDWCTSDTVNTAMGDFPCIETRQHNLVLNLGRRDLESQWSLFYEYSWCEGCKYQRTEIGNGSGKVFDDGWLVEYLDVASDSFEEDLANSETTSETYHQEFIGKINPDLTSMTLCVRSHDFEGQTVISETERQHHLQVCHLTFPIVVQ